MLRSSAGFADGNGGSTGAQQQGGREITRPVDLRTVPIYVRAGAIIPTGPVKQHTAETSDAPLTLTIYPGVDGATEVYEDDGVSFAHETGTYRTIAAHWRDAERRLVVSSPHGSGTRKLAIGLATGGAMRDIVFEGKELSLQF